MYSNIISPETSEELLKVINENQVKKFRFGAGYTDLIVELKKRPDEELTVINLAYLNDDLFSSIKKCDEGIRIGALVTANEMTSDKELKRQFPVLWEAANTLGSRQIRQLATVGGNLCTASPAGDIGCALVALEAQCEILSAVGTVRIIPMNSFFIDVKKTDLKKDEVLRSVLVPLNNNNQKIYSDFIRVGTRRSMEIAIVSIAYHIQVDEDDKITQAGIAIGSVAPTIQYAQSAGAYLKGKNFTSMGIAESQEFASKVLEYASPISDIRASAWYRKEVLFNISRCIFD